MNVTLIRSFVISPLSGILDKEFFDCLNSKYYDPNIFYIYNIRTDRIGLKSTFFLYPAFKWLFLLLNVSFPHNNETEICIPNEEAMIISINFATELTI